MFIRIFVKICALHPSDSLSTRDWSSTSSSIFDAIQNKIVPKSEVLERMLVRIMV